MNEVILISQWGEKIEYFSGYLILSKPVEYGYVSRYEVENFTFCWINFGSNPNKF